MRAAGRFANLQRCAAAGAGHGKPVCTALCQIVRDLRNDHIRAVYPNRITGTQLKRTEVVQIVQVGAADRWPSMLTGSNRAVRLTIPVRVVASSTLRNVVSYSSSAHLSAIRRFSWCPVAPRLLHTQDRHIP